MREGQFKKRLSDEYFREISQIDVKVNMVNVNYVRELWDEAKKELLECRNYCAMRKVVVKWFGDP